SKCALCRQWILCPLFLGVPQEHEAFEDIPVSLFSQKRGRKLLDGEQQLNPPVGEKLLAFARPRQISSALRRPVRVLCRRDRDDVGGHELWPFFRYAHGKTIVIVFG